MIDIDSRLAASFHASLAPLLDVLADAIVARINQRESGSRWLNEKQAAEHCAVHRRTIGSARRRGEILGRHRGRSYIFEIKDLDAWIASAEESRPVPPPGRLMTDEEIIRASAEWVPQRDSNPKYLAAEQKRADLSPPTSEGPTSTGLTGARAPTAFGGLLKMSDRRSPSATI